MDKQEYMVELATDSSLLFGLGKAIKSINTIVHEIAGTNIPVIIVGESGSGKDVYARLLHQLSSHSEAGLRKLNCTLLDPNELLRQVHCSVDTDPESHPTRTLFLDNIEELDPACQRALLSVLPDGQGATGIINNFPRLISSSSRNLDDYVATGKFRKELFFRISSIYLHLPPLRERKEDIVIFLEHFLRRCAQDLNRAVPVVEEQIRDFLAEYEWPGNIRQLENLARKIVLLGNAQLAINDIVKGRPPLTSVPESSSGSSLKTAAKAASQKAERDLILRALERTHWNRKRAARDLQISYKSLLYKIKQIGVSEGKQEG